MSHSEAAESRPLYLTEEEAVGLLELCLPSSALPGAARDRAMMKLTALVRAFMSEESDPALSALDEPVLAAIPAAAYASVRNSPDELLRGLVPAKKPVLSSAS